MIIENKYVKIKNGKEYTLKNKILDRYLNLFAQTQYDGSVIQEKGLLKANTECFMRFDTALPYIASSPKYSNKYKLNTNLTTRETLAYNSSTSSLSSNNDEIDITGDYDFSNYQIIGNTTQESWESPNKLDLDGLDITDSTNYYGLTQSVNFKTINGILNINGFNYKEYLKNYVEIGKVHLMAGTYTLSFNLINGVLSGEINTDKIMLVNSSQSINILLNKTNYTFTATDEEYTVYYYYSTYYKYDNVKIGLQIEEGSTATDFKPYGSKCPSVAFLGKLTSVSDISLTNSYPDDDDVTTKIDLHGYELRNLGESQDKSTVYKDELAITNTNKEILLQMTNKITLSGNDNWSISDDNTTSRRFVLSTSSTTIPRSAGDTSLCSALEYNTSNSNTHGYFYMNSVSIVITDNDKYWSDLTTFKNWLNNNTIEIIYPLSSVNTLELGKVIIPYSIETKVTDFNVCFETITATSTGNKSQVEAFYDYDTKFNLYDITNDKSIDNLDAYDGKKITALGFGNTKNNLYAVIDTNNYSIYYDKMQELSLSRKDIFKTDAICEGAIYPMHLDPIGITRVIDGTQYKLFGRLYSIGLGFTYNQMASELIVGKDIEVNKVYDNWYYFNIKKGSDNTMYPSTSRYPNSSKYPTSFSVKRESYPSKILYPSTSKYPMASNYKFVIFKYQVYYIIGNQIKTLDEYYTMGVQTDLQGLLQITTKIERND